jgi:hypothetical protein
MSPMPSLKPMVRAARRQQFHRVRVQAADAAVVHHHAEFDRIADGFHVRDQAVLRGFGQVVRHQQDALRAEAFGFLRKSDGGTGGAAGAGQDRHFAAAGFDRHPYHVGILGGGQRKELAGAACHKQGARTVGSQPFEPSCISARAEFALRIEIGDREGQQAGGKRLFEFLRIHGLGMK